MSTQPREDISSVLQSAKQSKVQHSTAQHMETEDVLIKIRRETKKTGETEREKDPTYTR